MAYELYSHLSSFDKEDLQKIHGKRLSRLDPHIKEHTTLSRLQSLDLEVSEMKTSLLDLHDKVSTLTFMLDTFMKEMKGMVVEDVVVEEKVDEGNAAKPQDNTVMEEVKEKAEKKEVADEKKQEEKEEEEKIKKLLMPPQFRPFLQPFKKTTSPGKTKPFKKRKTRSRK